MYLLLSLMKLLKTKHSRDIYIQLYISHIECITEILTPLRSTSKSKNK